MNIHSAIINTVVLNSEVGDYLSILAGEYVASELTLLASFGIDNTYSQRPYDWLYQNVDFSDEISDVQALDDMYRTTGDRLTEAISLLYQQQDYEDVKYYLTTHKETITEVDINTRETHIVVNIVRH